MAHCFFDKVYNLPLTKIINSGYKVKQANFQILGIQCPLTRFQEYHDEGFVPSAPKKILEIEQQYGSCTAARDVLWMIAAKIPLPRAGAPGFYSGIWPFRKLHVHVVYEDQGSDPENIFARGHEETHALERFGHLHLLQEKIEREGFKIQQDMNPVYQGTAYRESRANVGGLYAILWHGYSLSDVEDFHLSQNPLIIKSPGNI